MPVRFDQARLPIDVRAIHTTDLDDWHEDPSSPALRNYFKALGVVIANSKAANVADVAVGRAPTSPTPVKHARRFSICVLPFTNMSGDPEQEYFSDGISGDIITDLGKVSSLAVTSSNTAFRYKGRHADMATVARELKVTHVLEGSVRKAGDRIRINAQLIDGATDNQVWAERYDRDASDIFAIQDEISQAIVKALRLRLLPEEKKAIERRGTDSADAHDLYLMARQMYVTAQENDAPSAHAIIRVCTRAIEVDPDYAQAWALMAMGYRNLRELGNETEDGMAAAERALSLNPGLAEAHAVMAHILQLRGDCAAAATEAGIALELDPESYEANRTAGRVHYLQHHFEEAARLFEKAMQLMETDLNSAMLLSSTYRAMGDVEGMRRTAHALLQRADAALAKAPDNVGIIAYSATALGSLGEGERARTRMSRAMLIDPDNWLMRYNFACTLCGDLKDTESALEMVDTLLKTATRPLLDDTRADPDFASLHDDPRWHAMVAAAEARLAVAKDLAAPVASAN